MPFVEQIDRELTEELKKVTSPCKTRPHTASKRKAESVSQHDVSNSNVSQSTISDILDSSTGTDKILGGVIEMETEGYRTRSRSKLTPREDSSSNDLIFVSKQIPSFKQDEFVCKDWLKEREVIILPKSQRPTAAQGCVHIVSADHHYAQWPSVTLDLSNCSDINEMKTVIDMYQKNTTLDTNITTIFNVRLDWDNRDSLAHSLWPRDGPFDRSDAFEINTEAIGDCLPCAVSRLVFGTQNHARELRTRMTVEAILHKEWYLDHFNLALDLPQLETSYTLVEKYALFCGTTALVPDPLQCYDAEVTRCMTTNSYCGLWQIHQLSSVIGRPIITVFPEFDDMEDTAPLRYYHNRSIMPRVEEARVKDPVIIMWTKASAFSQNLANHFVAVVK